MRASYWRAEDAFLSRAERIGRQLRLFDQRGEAGLSLSDCVACNLALDLRKDQVRRDVAGIVRKFADFSWEADMQIGLSLSIRHPTMAVLLDRVTARLTMIADRPLTPRELLLALPITNRERLRWTKDNRLQRSGDVKIKQGQIVTVPTYLVAAAERLRDDQAILAQWREADRRAGH